MKGKNYTSVNFYPWTCINRLLNKMADYNKFTQHEPAIQSKISTSQLTWVSNIKKKRLHISAKLLAGVWLWRRAYAPTSKICSHDNLACIADETKLRWRTIPRFSFVCNAGYDNHEKIISESLLFHYYYFSTIL